jgi:hypothetical protein
MGHADSRTAEIYLGSSTPDGFAAAIQGFSFGVKIEQTFYPPHNVLANQ